MLIYQVKCIYTCHPFYTVTMSRFVYTFIRCCIAAVMGLCLSLPLTAGVTISKDPDTALIGWKLNQGGFELELIQRLPDQTRAFFLARGFSPKVANDIALACVFQGIGRNTLKASEANSISVDLREWQLTSKGKNHSIKQKEQWEAEWSGADVARSSRLAYRWATFPTQQTYEPVGDYNWGMISFNLPPGTRFDVLVRWTLNGKPQQAWVRDVACAKDIHPEPQ